MLSQWVMDTSKNNLYLSNKFVGRCPWSSKNPQVFFTHRHLIDWLMQTVLGISAAVAFQVDLGELGHILLYPIAPYLGKAYEERYWNILIWWHHCLTMQMQRLICAVIPNRPCPHSRWPEARQGIVPGICKVSGFPTDTAIWSQSDFRCHVFPTETDR